ncbi:MAG: type III-B CRISPR module-associated protein Cmr5 [Akkermansiaceae bacterium]|nr:type III-B CRISPR module-associated protein Cmr5 [Akkermansiaceae bacterium]
MQNLEQRRAAHALEKANDCRKRGDEGDCLSGYPGLIVNNGLLACLAFSVEKQKQHFRVANAIAYHLHEMNVCRRTQGGSADAAWLLNHLASPNCTALTLRWATSEALAFLGYLKRFVKTEIHVQTPDQP